MDTFEAVHSFRMLPGPPTRDPNAAGTTQLNFMSAP